ncbi:hypothetical protein ACLVWU_00330 [Bdellovibrio sp. HCB290]|uniref:hypothetical protein n=1 Tax=Bdellovibrio sp. HCB290 TaxID=3394356 RepID=UPI0039B62E0C
MKLQSTVLAIIILGSCSSFAQVASSTSSVNSSLEKKSEFSNSLQLGYVYNRLSMNTEGAKQKNDVSYEPSSPDNYAIGWSNRPLGISLSAKFAEGRQLERRVKTTRDDYQIRYLKEQLGLELIYQRYAGFEASGKYGQSMPTADAVRSNLTITMYKAQVEWKVHGVGALGYFGASWEKPKQDGAGYYLLSSISQVEVNNPTPFLPQMYAFAFGEDASITSGTYQSLQVGVGASYVWQWERFYIAIYGGAQGGPQKQIYKTTKGNEEAFKLFGNLESKLVLGYDFGNWFINAIGHTHPLTVDLKDTKLSFFTQDAGIYAGTRF